MSLSKKKWQLIAIVAVVLLALEVFGNGPTSAALGKFGN